MSSAWHTTRAKRIRKPPQACGTSDCSPLSTAHLVDGRGGQRHQDLTDPDHTTGAHFGQPRLHVRGPIARISIAAEGAYRLATYLQTERDVTAAWEGGGGKRGRKQHSEEQNFGTSAEESWSEEERREEFEGRGGTKRWSEEAEGGVGDKKCSEEVE